MGALSCGHQKLLWKSNSHAINLKHWSLHHLQYSCFYGQMQWQPYKHFLLNLFPYILKSWAKEAYHFRISLKLELYQEKTPPQMFLAFLAENGSVMCNQVPLSSQTPQSYFESSTHVQIYISSYYIYFREKSFSNIIMLQKRFPQMPKIQIYSENKIMTAKVFKFLPKSEEAVHWCSLKKLF